MTDVFLPKVNALAQSFIDDLLKEKKNLSEDFPLISLVLDDVVDRIYATGRIPGRDLPADIFKQKPIKLSQNVYLPIKQYPEFNFTGKILGPKGNTLKRLHTETMCKISIKGRSSMRNAEREEELRQSGDPALNHLNKNLHVQISTVAPPAEAYARMAYALTEIRKYIIPDKNDEISQEQYREHLELNPELAKRAPVQKSMYDKLQQLKGGFGGTNYEEEDSPSSPPHSYERKPQRGFQGRNTGPPTSSYADKTREWRSKPYQKYAPLKK